MKKRNSLIEFFRFLFAMNVLLCHGFFPLNTEHFGPDRISVEFFFLLSGFLFYHSLEKIEEMKTTEAVWVVLVTKLKPLLVPMGIGMLSNAILNVISDYRPKIEVFRYLWYIPAMMAILILYATLRTCTHNNKVFWCVVAGLCLTATLLRFSGNEKLFFFDYIRSTASVSLGILIAKIPKLKVKRSSILYLLLLPIVVVTFLIIYYRLAEEIVVYEALLDLILYPLLLYVTFQIDFHFALFDFLGALSFGIYAFQCPARLMVYIGVPSRWIPFFLIFFLTFIDYFVRFYIEKRKAQKVQYM